MLFTNKQIEDFVNENSELSLIIFEEAHKITISEPFPTLCGISPLQALALKESNYGSNNIPRYETSYGPGGPYYNVTHVQQLYKKYGKDACCSYSSFQIMFITAWELGYQNSPDKLTQDEIAIEFVIKMINQRIMKYGPISLDQIFDAYNSGSFKDKYIPKEYISEAKHYYKYFEGNLNVT
jgi:hypothetical protein